MVAHGLQRIAAGAREIAVIDDQRRAALSHDAAAERLRDIDRRRRSARDRSVGVRASRSGSIARLAVAPEEKRSSAPSPMRRSCQPPCASNCWIGSASKNSLAISSIGPAAGSRCRRGIAARSGRACPLARCAAPGLLDEMQPQGVGKARHAARGAQGIGHQGAAAGAELDQQHRIGRAEPLPIIGAPQADQLAEDLADLGRGDEIAARRRRDRGVA